MAWEVAAAAGAGLAVGTGWAAAGWAVLVAGEEVAALAAAAVD